MAVVQAQFLAPQENALGKAFGAALGNVAEGVAKGYEARQQAGKVSNATTFQGITNRLDAYYAQYGTPGFVITGKETAEELRIKQAAIRDLDTWGQTYEAISGGRVRPDQLEAMKNYYKAGVTTAGNLANLQDIHTGFEVEGQAAAASPPPSPPAGGGVAPGSTAASQAAEAAQRAAAMPRYDLKTVTNFLRGPYSSNLIVEPKTGFSIGPGMGTAPSSMSYAISPTITGVLEKYKSDPDVARLFATYRRDDRSPASLEQAVAHSLEQLFAKYPKLSDEVYEAAQADMQAKLNASVRPSQTGYSGMPGPSVLQQGTQANGTVSLEAHERRTGDDHYPARVGVEEGIVNAVAMKQPGVAEMIMDLNRRFPANVAASRGMYADGYAPPIQRYEEAPTLDEGGVPAARMPQGEANYMGAIQALNASAADTSARSAQAPAVPAYEPTPRTPGDPIAQRDAQLAEENAQRLVARAKAKIAELSGPEPRHTNKYLAAMDEIAQHARDVQAKYQINWENPDPRERAILQRELAWEQRATRAAMAADKPRQEWQQQALSNIKNFMRNASDEEIAQAFGPEVATARNNRLTRALGWKQLDVEARKALNESTAMESYGQTLAAKVMMDAFSPMAQKFVVDGKFQDEEFAKALKAIPMLKNSADITNMVMTQSPTAGVANIEEKGTNIWNFLQANKGFKFDYSGQGGAAQAAGEPQFSSNATSLMSEIGK